MLIAKTVRCSTGTDTAPRRPERREQSGSPVALRRSDTMAAVRYEWRQGRLPGDRYVRIVPSADSGLCKADPEAAASRRG